MAIIEVIAEKKASREIKANSGPIQLQLHRQTNAPHPPDKFKQTRRPYWPGPRRLLFPADALARFTALIKSDKFNEPLSEKEKLLRLWFPSQAQRGLVDHMIPASLVHILPLDLTRRRHSYYARVDGSYLNVWRSNIIGKMISHIYNNKTNKNCTGIFFFL